VSTIVFDIETVGHDFDSLDERSKESFLKYAKTEEEIDAAKNSLGLFPLTGKIVAIGMLEVESDKGCVYFQNGNSPKEKFEENDITYISGNEKEILQYFWKQLKRYKQYVTFNGRGFDGPFIMIRSAIHSVKSEKNLVPYRYTFKEHVDLADQMSFYGASRRNFSLHMWCQAFGIKSPKKEGISGDAVQDLFAQDHYLEIARYCMGDVIATKQLFLYWDKYIKQV